MKKNTNKTDEVVILPELTPKQFNLSKAGAAKLFIVVSKNLKKNQALLNLADALLDMYFTDKRSGYAPSTLQWRFKMSTEMKNIFKGCLSQGIDWDLRKMPEEVIDTVASLFNNPTCMYKWLIKGHHLTDKRNNHLTVDATNVDVQIHHWESNN